MALYGQLHGLCNLLLLIPEIERSSMQQRSGSRKMRQQIKQTAIISPVTTMDLHETCNDCDDCDGDDDQDGDKDGGDVDPHDNDDNDSDDDELDLTRYYEESASDTQL